MTEISRQLIAGSAAAVCLAVLATRSDFVFWFNLIISAAIGLGTYFTIPKKRSPREIEVAPGITQDRLDAALETVADYQDRFRVLISRTADPGAKGMIRDLRNMLKKIGGHFREDPRDLTNSSTHMFLDQYLPRSFDLLSKYVRLSHATRDAAGREQLANAETAIRRIQAGFQEFYRKCLQNDLIDLEVESETLNAIMDMDFPELDARERSDH